MWLIVALLLVLPYPTQAESQCVNDYRERCEELGYTESSCQYGGVACQYDTSKWHCAKWECKDGKYYTADNKPPEDKYSCTEIEFKGLACFDCSIECEEGQVNYNNCWDGKMAEIVRPENPVEFCASLGYEDSSEDCTNYLRCPADLNRVHCFN